MCVMKTKIKQFVPFLVIAVLCSMFWTSYADKQKEDIKDFVFKLGAGVNAEWKNEEQVLRIYGDGKIDSAKWQELARIFNADNMDKTKLWTSRNNFTMVFVDRTVRLPDVTMIGNVGFFENFGGEIQSLSQIDTSNVTEMSRMFANVKNADPSIGSWNTSNVNKMASMFEGSNMNPDISRWDVSNVTDMSKMFFGATKADPNLSAWRPRRLSNMSDMLNGANSIVEINLVSWGRILNVEASGAFLNLPNLKFLEFDGLKFDGAERVQLNNFAGGYFVDRIDGSGKTEIISNPTQGYSFENNAYYRVSLICTVKFDTDGGNSIANAIVGYNQKVSQPQNPTKNGYEFVRWEKNGSAYDFDSPVLGDMTLRAIWKKSGAETVTPPVSGENLTVKFRIGSWILTKEVGGKTTQVMMDALPFIEQGRVMLPLRYAAEALGMGVAWDNQTKVVTLKDKTNEVTIPVRTNQIIVNGTTYYSDVQPILRSGRVFLSVSNIARPLGLEHGKTIFWDNETKTATFVRKLSEI